MSRVMPTWQELFMRVLSSVEGGRAPMCCANPEELLAKILAEPLPRNENDNTPLDGCDYFCAFSGLSEPQAGRVAFAWAKVAYCGLG